MFLLLAILVCIPLFEIYLFIEVGRMIGGWETILLILLTAFVGMVMIRTQGMRTFWEFQQKRASGNVPVNEMFDGLCLLFSGVFLLLPGFFTDTLGFLLLIPAFRRFLQESVIDGFLGAYTFGVVDTETVKWGKEKVDQKMSRREGNATKQPDVIDADFEVIEKQDKKDL